MLAKVRDIKTGQEKPVAVKAYELLKNRYQLLGYVEDDGVTPVEGMSVSQPVAKTKKKEVAGPVVVSKLTPEDIEAKKAEIALLNQAAINAAKGKVQEQLLVDNSVKLQQEKSDTAQLKKSSTPKKKK